MNPTREPNIVRYSGRLDIAENLERTTEVAADGVRLQVGVDLVAEYAPSAIPPSETPRRTRMALREAR